MHVLEPYTTSLQQKHIFLGEKIALSVHIGTLHTNPQKGR
jgi:hypothetical protein